MVKYIIIDEQNGLYLTWDNKPSQDELADFLSHYNHGDDLAEVRLYEVKKGSPVYTVYDTDFDKATAVAAR